MGSSVTASGKTYQVYVEEWTDSNGELQATLYIYDPTEKLMAYVTGPETSTPSDDGNANTYTITDTEFESTFAFVLTETDDAGNHILDLGATYGTATLEPCTPDELDSSISALNYTESSVLQN